jgi:hypothetical protein
LSGSCFQPFHTEFKTAAIALVLPCFRPAALRVPATKLVPASSRHPRGYSKTPRRPIQNVPHHPLRTFDDGGIAPADGVHSPGEQIEIPRQSRFATREAGSYLLHPRQERRVLPVTRIIFESAARLLVGDGLHLMFAEDADREPLAQWQPWLATGIGAPATMASSGKTGISLWHDGSLSPRNRTEAWRHPRRGEGASERARTLACDTRGRPSARPAAATMAPYGRSPLVPPGTGAICTMCALRCAH